MSNKIKGVPSFNSEDDCGWMRFFGALTSVMRSQGEDVDYAYLLGVSGAAFRLKIEPKGWCASAQDPAGDTAIYPHQVLTAMGYQGTYVDGKKEGKKVLSQIRSQIDKGIPPIVSGAGIHQAPDFSSVITGYEGEDKFFFISYNHNREDYDSTSADKILGTTLLLQKSGKKLTSLDALRQSLQLAVRMADTKDSNGNVYGFSAYSQWIDRLKTMEDDFSRMGTEKLKSEWEANAMNYEGLCDARGAAIRYLSRVQKELSSADSLRLKQVVEKFAEIRKLVFDSWLWFPFPFWVREKEGKIWTPTGLLEGTTWSPEIRKKEVEALILIMKAEKEAISLIEHFLKATQ